MYMLVHSDDRKKVRSTHLDGRKRNRSTGRASSSSADSSSECTSRGAVAHEEGSHQKVT
jgi:hypothetical protein